VKFQIDVDCRVVVEPLLQCGNCDLKLEILYNCIAIEVVKILSPILFFAWIFQHDKTNNMMAFMLDLKFKGLTCIHEFANQKFEGHGNCTRIQPTLFVAYACVSE